MYKDIERKRAQSRKWMAKWREENRAECNRQGRERYHRSSAAALRERRFSRAQWAGMRQGAEKRGLTFNLNREEVVIPDRCPVLGLPLDRSSYDNTPSLDRIDNAVGYEAGNVVVVSRRANGLKRDASIDELCALAAFYARFK